MIGKFICACVSLWHLSSIYTIGISVGATSSVRCSLVRSIDRLLSRQKRTVLAMRNENVYNTYMVYKPVM